MPESLNSGLERPRFGTNRVRYCFASRFIKTATRYGGKLLREGHRSDGNTPTPGSDLALKQML